MISLEKADNGNVKIRVKEIAEDGGTQT